MFSLAFFALLRIGELAVKRGNLSSKVLQLCDVSWQNNKRILIIVLRHFKHNSSGRPVTLELRKQGNAICPVTLMSKYLSIRSSKQGPLFIFVDGSPITVSFFNLELKKYLRSSGFSTKKYKGHSFSIGGATAAALNGFSDLEIQGMGRWKSGAFKKYIRIGTISN